MMTSEISKELCLNGQNFTLNYPAIMGILNVTPDSFSDGGDYTDLSNAEQRIETMLDEGAQIIDIGAESTRPGSDSISANEELDRLMPVLEEIPKDRYIISVDSSKIEVQQAALKAGAHIINDITGGSEALFAEAQKYQAGLVIMHTPASPKDMQEHTQYEDVVEAVLSYFENRQSLLSECNIPFICFDPGIGFGKTLEQNIELMKHVDKFSTPSNQLLIGSSRKSWIGGLCDADVTQRLGASLSSIVMCYLKGVQVFRVHDVKESVQALTVARVLQK